MSCFTIHLGLKTGEFLRIDEKKHPIFELSITSDGHFPANLHFELQKFADKLSSTLAIKENRHTLDMVLFT